MKQKPKRDSKCLVVGTWNVHTLVECLGDERVCRKRPMEGTKHSNHSDNPGKVVRKLDLLVGELEDMECLSQ